MRKGVVPALAIAMTMPANLSARSDEIPTLDVAPVCGGIASQSIFGKTQKGGLGGLLGGIGSMLGGAGQLGGLGAMAMAGMI